MHPIIIIPARMASRRLPGKPLLDVGGAPMIVQVWRRAAESGAADVLVACDGHAIAGVIANAGGKAVLTDPALPSGSDRVFAALSAIDPEKKYDVIVNLQGDMPTIDPAMIASALKLMDDPRVDIATLAAPLEEERDKNDTAVVKVRIQDSESGIHGKAVSFSRQMPEDGQAFQHIGIYVYRRAALEKFVCLPQSPLEKKEKLEQLRALEAGMHIEVSIVDKAPAGVDTPETLEQARKEYGQSR